MSYEDIRIAGELTEALEAWLAQRYGRVVDMEVGGGNEGEYAAVAYAAVESPEPSGPVRAVVLVLKHDPKGGVDGYHFCRGRGGDCRFLSGPYSRPIIAN